MPTNQNGTITQLLRRIADGDDGAMEDLYQHVLLQLADRAQRYLRRFPGLANDLEPDDVINETYEGVACRLASGEIQNSPHFFATICLHFRWEMQTQIRRRGGLPPIGQLPAEEVVGKEPPPIDQIVREDLIHLVMRARDDLEEPQQTIINLYFWDDATLQEIGEYLGMSHSSVHRCLWKAIGELHRRLGDAHGGDRG